MSEASTKQVNRLKWILPIAIILVAILAFTALVNSKPQAPSRPVAEKVWSVQTISATPGTHQPALTLYGTVESPRMTRMTAAVTAFIQSVDTDEGKTILQDQLLIKLDDRDAQLQLSQRQADVDNYLAQIEAEKVRYQSDLKSQKIERNLQQLSLKTVERYKNLIKRKVASQENLDSARRDYQQQTLSLTQRERSIADHPNRLQQLESQLKRAQSLLEAAQLDLDRTQIKAPFQGRIATLNVSPGDRVRAGDPLLSLYSLERLEVRAQVPSRILPELRDQDGMAINAVGLIDNRAIALKLDRIAAEVNAGRAGVDALFKITPSSYHPEPGRTLEIKVDLPPVRGVIPIPPVALYGLNRVYRVVDNTLEAIQVERLGDSYNDQGEAIVLIRSTRIQPGDRLVTTQLPNAISGLKVKDIAASDKAQPHE